MRRYLLPDQRQAAHVPKAQMAAEFAETRRRGYSLSRGEFIDSVMSLALPLFDRFGQVRMCCSVLACPRTNTVPATASDG